MNNILVVGSINMDMILGYKKDGVRHTFLEEYDQKKTKK